MYDRISEIAKLHVEEQLKSLHLCNGNDFPNHIALLKKLWQKINFIDRTINDAIFRSILLSLLPILWDLIVTMLYTTILFTDTLIQLDT